MHRIASDNMHRTASDHMHRIASDHMHPFVIRLIFCTKKNRIGSYAVSESGSGDVVSTT